MPRREAAMHVQEQAFRAYYASMSDGDLLAVAANRTSFIDLAQQILREELDRRKLPVPADASPPQAAHSAGGLGAAMHKLFHLRRHPAHP
jgi:hypothetical protein